MGFLSGVVWFRPTPGTMRRVTRGNLVNVRALSKTMFNAMSAIVNQPARRAGNMNTADGARMFWEDGELQIFRS